MIPCVAVEIVSRRGRVQPGDEARAVAYVRTSTTEQTLGLEAQRSQIEAHAARSGYAVCSWHIEQASGTLPAEQRPELLAALGAIEAHHAGLLVVARRDRLARDTVVAGLVERLVARRGARVVSVAGEGSEDAGPSGVFMRSVIDATAQFEVASLRWRTRAGLAARKAKGLRVGAIPYGWQADDAGHLLPHPDEQRTLARVAELYAIGHTVTEATATLAREGYRSRRGSPLSRSRVGALFYTLKRKAQP